MYNKGALENLDKQIVEKVKSKMEKWTSLQYFFGRLGTNVSKYIWKQKLQLVERIWMEDFDQIFQDNTNPK